MCICNKIYICIILLIQLYIVWSHLNLSKILLHSLLLSYSVTNSLVILFHDHFCSLKIIWYYNLASCLSFHQKFNCWFLIFSLLIFGQRYMLNDSSSLCLFKLSQDFYFANRTLFGYWAEFLLELNYMS